MYDARTLKRKILVSETQVECPVMGCSRKVARQRKEFRREPRFHCREHQIYISPSTLEYQTELDNLLWQDEQDIALLENIKTVKRESRMARDNSEDALTWNVFRYLERANSLSVWLTFITGKNISDLELIYWSYSSTFQGVWPELADARQEFGEEIPCSSEPDLIAWNNKMLFFIETKFTASNETTPSDPQNQKRYVTGCSHWYQQVCASDYDTVANVAKKYELLRFWLLGSWIGAQSGRDFYLVNLVRSEYEQDIERLFVPHVKPSPSRHFMRTTWEAIYKYIIRNVPTSGARNRLLDYLDHKTVGYNRFGELQRAFSISKGFLSDTKGG